MQLRLSCRSASLHQLLCTDVLTFVLPDSETWHGRHWAWVNMSSSKPQVLGILWAFSYALWLSRECVTVCFSCFLTSLPWLPMLLFSLSCSRACWGGLNWAVTPPLWPGSSRDSENFCEKSWPCSPDPPLWHVLGERSLSDSSAGRVLCMQQCLYFTSLPPYCGTSLGVMLAPSGSALCLGWSSPSCSESTSPLICLQTYLDPGVPGSSP